jgi:flagellar biosynthesis GTPase FlhF
MPRNRCTTSSLRLSFLSSRRILESAFAHRPGTTSLTFSQEAERKRCLEDAVVHRKRSSRIAIKESEKEEARMIAKKRADEEEKLSRTKRLKARLEKEEGDRAMRESAREQRKREREAKERQQLQKLEEGFVSCCIFCPDFLTRLLISSDSVVDVTGNDPLHPGRNSVVADRPNGALNGTGSGSRTPTGDDWELDCEVCCKRGVNQVSVSSSLLIVLAEISRRQDFG